MGTVSEYKTGQSLAMRNQLYKMWFSRPGDLTKILAKYWREQFGYDRQEAGLYLSAIVPLLHFQLTVLVPFNTG